MVEQRAKKKRDKVERLLEVRATTNALGIITFSISALCIHTSHHTLQVLEEIAKLPPLHFCGSYARGVKETSQGQASATSSLLAHPANSRKKKDEAEEQQEEEEEKD